MSALFYKFAVCVLVMLLYLRRMVVKNALRQKPTTIFLLILFIILKTATGQVILNGKVTNSAGLPLQGVNIIDLDSKLGTATNAAGEYSLLLFQRSTVVRVSHIGYATVEKFFSDSIIEKSQNDTIRRNFILSVVPKALPEVDISADLKRSISKTDMFITCGQGKSQPIVKTSTGNGWINLTNHPLPTYYLSLLCKPMLVQHT